MNRPRLTIAVLRGLDEMFALGHCQYEAMYDYEQKEYSERDIERADEWLAAMFAWYRSKEVQP